jgi:glycosyltransferase involved in cell wall biosynthesis
VAHVRDRTATVLTVFVATHDGAETLPRVLDAYTRLIAPRGGWKVVIIDNASDDGSAAILQTFADRLPLEVMHEPRRGKNYALNAGLSRLDGNLAVFSDDDTLPEPDWLERLRAAADRHPECAAFGGSIVPLWDKQPEAWVLDWVPAAPAFSVTDTNRDEGPCDATKVWGPNMAVRAEWFERGYRFDERLGPNGSATYSMGGETELVLRLTIAEAVGCWHCRDARVRHIIPARKMTRAWILKRAFHLGRCLHRESKQLAAAGRPHIRRDPAAIRAGLTREVVRLASSRRAGDARGAFEARWQLNVWCGCLYQALSTRHRAQRPQHHAGLPA